MTKDWSGNSRSFASTLGAHIYTEEEREKNDYYATDPKSIEVFLERIKKDNIELHEPIWECACGQGHLAEELIKNNFQVKSTDLIDRGYGVGGVDFLKTYQMHDGDIITNPPYKYAKEFVEQGMKITQDGHYVIMLLKLQFLEGKARRLLFEKFPPKFVYVFSERQRCAMNGNFEKYSNNGMTHGAVAYAWFIWQKGFTSEPIIRWI